MCLDVIHQSFKTVADEFGLTQENCPKHTSFIPLCFLETQMNWGWHMYALYDGKKIIGYMSLSKKATMPLNFTTLLFCQSIDTMDSENFFLILQRKR